MKKKNNGILHREMFLKLTTSYFEEIQQSINRLDKDAIAKVVEMLLSAYWGNKKIYVLGNGGSASVASHISCDLGKGTLRRAYDNKERRLRVVSLTDNISLITAYANDLSFDNIFLQQLRNLVEKGDVVIGISGSGNSKNVLRAISYAKKIGAKTIAFTGFHTGGKLGSLVDIPIIVQSNHYGPVEDVHMMLAHIITTCIASIKQIESGNGKKTLNKSVPFHIED